MTAGPPRPSFRIDPRAAERAPPPAPLPPPRPAAAPPPPSPAPPAPGPAPRRRRWWIPALVVAAVVVVAALGYAGYQFVKEETYPQKYLLSASQTPKGLSISPPSDMGALKGQIEPGKNPSPFTQDGLDAMAGQAGVRPDEAWGESFDTPSRQGNLAIIAMKFGSRDDADAAVARLRFACNLASPLTAVLQDGDVVVVVAAQGFEPGTYEPRVVKALQAKASGLRLACSG